MRFKRSLALALVLGALALPAAAQIPTILPVPAVTESIPGLVSTTSGAMVLPVGAGRAYTTLQSALNAIPTAIAHAVVINVAVGTDLGDSATLHNRLHAGGSVYIQAEKYFPTASEGAVPIATAAGATYLTDADVFETDDEYNSCWVFIVSGTGIDNGFVPIADTVAAEGRIYVAAWPGTQPDVTSKYIIVGALFNIGAFKAGLQFQNIGSPIYLNGLGCKATIGTASYGITATNCGIVLQTCGATGFNHGGFNFVGGGPNLYNCGSVANNTGSNSHQGGYTIQYGGYLYLYDCYSSNNKVAGVMASYNSYVEVESCGGTAGANQTWGVGTVDAGRSRLIGTAFPGITGTVSGWEGQKPLRMIATLPDDGTVSLGVSCTTGGFGWVIIGNNVERCQFFLDENGDVTLANNSANIVANADTDTKFCVGTAAAQEPLTIKNRLGGSRTVQIVFWYD